MIETKEQGETYYATKLFEETRDLLAWAEGTDFFEAPASTKYHGAEPFGLVKHSIAVLNAYTDKTHFLTNYRDDEINILYEQDAIVACLFHDVCKAGLYIKRMLWRKDNNGKWESYQGYVVDETKVQVGHGTESLRIIEQFYTFHNECWAQAVAWHMGPPEDWIKKQQYYHALEKYPEVLALHTADVYASFIGRC